MTLLTSTVMVEYKQLLLLLLPEVVPVVLVTDSYRSVPVVM